MMALMATVTPALHVSLGNSRMSGGNWCVMIVMQAHIHQALHPPAHHVQQAHIRQTLQHPPAHLVHLRAIL
jgi:hypothetical protein